MILAPGARGPGFDSLLSPFGGRAEMHPWQDSNLQPPDPWSGALPLSHTDTAVATTGLQLVCRARALSSVEERPFRIREVEGSNPSVSTLRGGNCYLQTQTAGFEPAHAEHTRLAGEPRNHLGTSAVHTTVRTRGCAARCLSHGVVVSTQDPESCDRGSNPRGRIFSTGRVAQGIAPGSPTQKRDLRGNRTAVVGFGIRSATATR